MPPFNRIEGLAELRSDPIFLSQFLRLPLQPIHAVDANHARRQYPKDPAYTPLMAPPAEVVRFPPFVHLDSRLRRGREEIAELAGR